MKHLESERYNTPATRNSRLPAIHSFCKYLLRNDLSHAAQYNQVLALELKRVPTMPATYLEPEEMQSIISQPDTRTAFGFRDYALLQFLYNSGARVAEALRARVVEKGLSNGALDGLGRLCLSPRAAPTLKVDLVRFFGRLIERELPEIQPKKVVQASRLHIAA